jgi:signal transduction histidine kinase
MRSHQEAVDERQDALGTSREAPKFGGGNRRFRSRRLSEVPAVSLAGPSAVRRRRLVHDVQHESSTLAVLASAIAHSGDLGTAGRRMAEQLVGESRRLDELVAALCQSVGTDDHAPITRLACVPLDELVRNAVAPFRSTSSVDIEVLTTAATVRGDPTDLWRAVTNLVRNAVTAVRARGYIEVRLSRCGGYARVDVDDDGPGMPDGPRPDGALGLTIVDEIAASIGGALEIGASPLGGCRARLLLPLA